MNKKANPISYYSDYIKKWIADADFFDSNGFYEWMSESVNKFELILEIGCGSGQSTRTLLQNGHKVIAIEENPICFTN